MKQFFLNKLRSEMYKLCLPIMSSERRGASLCCIASHPRHNIRFCRCKKKCCNKTPLQINDKINFVKTRSSKVEPILILAWTIIGKNNKHTLGSLRIRDYKVGTNTTKTYGLMHRRVSKDLERSKSFDGLSCFQHITYRWILICSASQSKP